ncbi:MAG: hypothetical protein K2V38_28730, partial [Gemmataceae bacterium]|nr:hypothetical protein [Gemmataceae bacterium]
GTMILQSLAGLPAFLVYFCTGLIAMTDLEELLAQVSVEAKRDLQIVERRGPSPDHPVAVTCRESGYLKCLVSRVG